MPTMNVNLTEKLARFVQGEVEQGNYQNASEMVRHALRVLAHEKELAASREDMFQEAVLVGLAQADAGEFSPRSLDDIFNEVKSKYQRPA